MANGNQYFVACKNHINSAQGTILPLYRILVYYLIKETYFLKRLTYLITDTHMYIFEIYKK